MLLKAKFKIRFLLLCVVFLLSKEAFTQSAFEKSFRTTFPNQKANMVSYIQFPVGVSFGGYFEIEVIGWYNNELNRGLLKKRLDILFNGTTGSYLSQQGTVVVATEPLARQWHIGDFDPVNYRIPIYHLVSTGNDLLVVIRGQLLNPSSATQLKNDLTLSTPTAITGIPVGRSYKNMSETRIGIGTNSPEHRLDVVGTIRAHEIMVNTSKTADHVFEPDYELRTLKDLEGFVKEKKHLPEVPSAKEMEKNGLEISSFQIDLLKKIEELTLYVIDLQKQITALEKERGKSGL